MKLFYHFTIILIIFCSSAIGQKNAIYKYSYRIETKKRIDTGIIKIDITDNFDNSYMFSCTILDNDRTPLLLVSFMLVSKQVSLYVQTDTLGKASIKIKKGYYTIHLSSVGVKMIDSAVNITGEIHKNLNFALDRTMPNAFIIHSVRRLTRKEIESIKRCVEANRWNECKQKELFTLGIEI